MFGLESADEVREGLAVSAQEIGDGNGGRYTGVCQDSGLLVGGGGQSANVYWDGGNVAVEKRGVCGWVGCACELDG